MFKWDAEFDSQKKKDLDDDNSSDEDKVVDDEGNVWKSSKQTDPQQVVLDEEKGGGGGTLAGHPRTPYVVGSPSTTIPPPPHTTTASTTKGNNRRWGFGGGGGGGGNGHQWRQNQQRQRRSFKFPKLFDTTTKIYLWIVFGVSLVLLAIILLAVSLKKVESTEYGLQYNVHKKVLDDAAKVGGLHLGVPGYEFIKFPSTFVTVDLPSGTCVSKDGLRVEFQVTFQYQILYEWIKPVVLKYRDFYRWATVVEAAGTSAIHHTCSEFSITNFQNQRGIIQTTMESNLRDKLEGPDRDGAGGVYARAISLQLRNVELPSEYQEAVRQKQAAAEDIELAKNQKTQELTKANTELLTSQEQARKILNTAKNDVNVTLTEAALKAEEITYTFEKEAEVIVRARNALNLTTNGILTMLNNRLYAEVPTLTVSAGEPAKMSRADEL